MWPQQQMKGTNSKIGQVTLVLVLFDGRKKKKKEKREEWVVSNGENCLLFRNSGSLRYNCKIPLSGGFRPSQGATLPFSTEFVYVGQFIEAIFARQPAG